jgi:mono/diheme cytochrome c family protein
MLIQQNSLIMKTTKNRFLIFGVLALVLQSCTHDVYTDPLADVKQAYDNADAVNGAKLFNNFQHIDAGWPAVTQADINQDATLAGLLGYPNPAFANDPTINVRYIATGPTGSTDKNRNFYSCSGCHAYDGMGRDEYGNNKKVAATQPDFAVSHLRDCRTWDVQTIFNAIKNVGGRAIDPAKTINGLDLTLGGQTHPDYSRILSDEKIWDLVKWLKEGAIYNESTAAFPNGDLYSVTTTGTYAVPQTVPAPYATFSNWGTDGDEVAGLSFYVAKCVVCHGADGRGTTNAQGPILGTGEINGTNGAGAAIPGTTPKKYGLGPFVRYRTPEAIHKIISGQFGTTPWMAATPITREQMKNLLKAFSNPNRFPDFDTALPNP